MLKSLFQYSRKAAMIAALGALPLISACSGEEGAEAVDASAAMIELEPIGADYEFSEEEQMFIVGTAIDVMFHEGGHMVIDLFDIPIMGQQEDAADNFATLALLFMDDEFATAALMEGISGWYLLSAYEDPDMSAFFAQHDLGMQRASRKICHLITADPETYGVIADEMGLDEMATATCAQQFDEASENWTRMLTERNAFGESQFDITYEYGETTPDLQPYRNVLEGSEMLEFVAQYLITTLSLPKEITVRTATCDTPNAFYDPSDNSLTYCYEFAQLLHNYYRISEAEEAAGAGAATEG